MIEEIKPLASLQQSQYVKVQGNGLVALVDIPPQKTLLSIEHRDTICHSNIPREFKQLLMPINNHRFVSKQTQIQKQINVNNELLLLYLIHLKHYKQQAIYKQWFARPLTAMYFFSRKNIELTQNLDLLIDYVAEHNHILEITQVLFNLLNKLQLIQLLFGSPVTQEIFTQNYEWSYHFINNRSFGYTEEYTLIPTFDMINHSSLKTNSAQLLSNQSPPTKNQLQSITNKQFIANYQSDNESEDDQKNKSENKRALNKNFYYHIISTEHIASGEQILIEYGNRNNKFLLQGYGFVEQKNPYDSLFIYIDPSHQRILYDSVKGQGCKSYKLKRNLFDFNFFIDMKKHYYQQYYNKDPSKAKVFWSKPKDKEFERYFIQRLINRMINNQPSLHIFDHKQKGACELARFQAQRLAIYRINISHLVKLQNALTNSQNASNEINLSECLQQYLVLLNQL